MQWLYLVLLSLSLLGCGERIGLAPVEELKWKQQNNHQTAHRVRAGETLYAIAFHYDVDYRELAAYNRLRNPFSLRVGQLLRIPYARQNHRNSYAPINKVMHPLRPISKKIPQPIPAHNRYFGSNRWVWPANGRVVANFFPLQGKKGIDIAGKKGDIVKASSSGVVAYAGSGLSGYGNLIIIKHDGQFLTAYGNNLRNRVKEGQQVKAGQIIAEMGIVDRKFWGVHFEIRKIGQPVNPMSYLPRQ